jgi:diaminopimelate decarboxylase
MDSFYYKSGELHCEDVNLSEVADQFNTPAYVYSKEKIKLNAKAYVESFKGKGNLACFSVKSLNNISILRIIKDSGCGFDIVSGGELHRVLSVGADPKTIIFSGVGKSKDEIKKGILNKILSFNVESASELYNIEEVAKELSMVAPVSIRFNPDIDSGGHDYITTGRKGDKFGITSKEEIINLSKHIASSDELQMVGLACHIGSQILELESFKETAKKTIELADDLIEIGIHLDFLDLGGGLGVSYSDETTPPPQDLVSCLEEEFRDRKERLILEPGRSISANAGILLTKIEYIKDNFLIVDAAMNDLLRPALYKAEHGACNIKEKSKNNQIWNIVGPICESSDFLGKDITIDADEGDILAIRTVGAYGFVMSSNYNARPRACEILIDSSNASLIRKRETYDDLLKAEIDIND